MAQLNKMFLMSLLLLLALAQPIKSANKTANTTFYHESITNVCSTMKIETVHAGQPIPFCKGLPDRREDALDPRPFFEEVERKWLWEQKCEDKSSDEPEARDQPALQASFEQVTAVMDTIKVGLEAVETMLINIAADVSRFSLVAKNWNWFWFIPMSLAMSVLYFVVGLFVVQNNDKVWRSVFTNFIAGFVLITVYSIETLYLKKYTANYSGTLMTGFGIYSFISQTPFFRETPFSGLGTSILIHLLIPIAGTLAYAKFNTTFFFGPVISIIINVSQIILHILCLFWLFIDEKLIIVKTLFLPLIQTFQNLVKESEKSQTEIDMMRQANENMTLDIFNSFEYEGDVQLSDVQALDKALTQAMTKMCEKLQGDWKVSCYPMVKAACADVSWNIGGVIGFFAPWMFCPSISTEVCKETTDLSGDFSTIEEFCKGSTASNESVFNFLFNKIGAYWEQIRREIIVDPETISVNQQLMGELEGFNLFQASWTWWLHVIIDIGFSIFVSSLLLIAIIEAVYALTAYKSNDDFTNNYLSKDFIESRANEGLPIRLTRKEKRKYLTNPKESTKDYIRYMWYNKPRFYDMMKPLILATFCYFFDIGCKLLHEKLQTIDFVVGEFGEARFIFNVEGTSVMANMMKTILGGFSFNSKYCTVADSSICFSSFDTIPSLMWLEVFGLAVLYFAIGVYNTKSNYLLCVAFDFLMPERARDRGNALLRQIVEAQDQHRQVRYLAAKERAENLGYVAKIENDKVIAFLRSYRFWVTYLPDLMVNMLAYSRGAWSIYCQFGCGQIVTNTFICKKFLFCEECAFHLIHCPCSSSICKRDANNIPYDSDEKRPPMLDI